MILNGESLVPYLTIPKTIEGFIKPVLVSHYHFCKKFCSKRDNLSIKHITWLLGRIDIVT